MIEDSVTWLKMQEDDSMSVTLDIGKFPIFPQFYSSSYPNFKNINHKLSQATPVQHAFIYVLL